MKKIIALTVALTVIISILNISAFATSEPTAMTSYEFHAAQADLIEKFVNGDITYSEWNERQVAVLDEYLEANKSVGDSAYASAVAIGNRFQGITQKINSAVSEWGDGARERVSDWWNSVCNSNNVPIEATQTSNTDMKGYSSKYIAHGSGNAYTVYYIDGYILIDDNGTSVRVSYHNGSSNAPNVMVEFYQYDKNTKSHYLYSGYPKYTTLGGSGSYAGNILYEDIAKGVKEFYGDVRYGDGSQFPTNDEFEYGSIKKFDEMPEKDLEDLLNDFSEEMERQNPDLSSIEGLLRAIYARMGTLDSDNDNDLLSEINTSIQSLNASISDLSTSIETSINDLKETITSLFSNGDIKDDDNTETSEHEISGTLYNVIPLEKNWLQKITHDKTNLHVEYQGKEYYLESDGTLLLDGKYYNVDMNYSSTLDEILYTLLDIRDSVNLLTEEERQMSFSDYFDLKFEDFKLDFDEKFEFKDNLKTFMENVFNSFESSIPEYNGG